MTLIIYSIMFATLFPPQVIIYTLLMGPLGAIGAWYTLILQASRLSIFIMSISLMPHIQRVAYDAVLVRECSEDVVLMGKLRRYKKFPLRAKISEYLKDIANLSTFPILVVKLLILGFFYFIPIVDPFIWLVFRASKRGVKAHARYFKLKGFLKSDIRKIHKLNRSAYRGYGVVALLFEQVPFVNMFFMFTNTLGAALWVVEIEKQFKKTAEQNAIEMKQLTGLIDKMQEQMDQNGNGGQSPLSQQLSLTNKPMQPSQWEQENMNINNSTITISQN